MMKAQYSVRFLCRCFQVSASGYYGWHQRQSKPSARARANQELKTHILRIHQDSRQTYGSPRIQVCLRREGRSHGRNRIGRLMREAKICGRQRRRYRVRTTDSNHDQPIAPNRLAQQGPPSRPNQVWVADITYVPTAEGWLFLAAVVDLHSRRVVGWSMGQRIDTALVLAAWNMAVCHRQPAGQLLFHSDRGVQYASADFRQSLKQQGVLSSMSRKANCYDNAAMEAFWSTLKVELIYRRPLGSRQEAEREIFNYIETFYNRRRLHSSLGYQSPVDFECANN